MKKPIVNPAQKPNWSTQISAPLELLKGAVKRDPFANLAEQVSNLFAFAVFCLHANSRYLPQTMFEIYYASGCDRRFLYRLLLPSMKPRSTEGKNGLNHLIVGSLLLLARTQTLP
jgi:hypothetical protein